jgi:hypothetical protein
MRVEAEVSVFDTLAGVNVLMLCSLPTFMAEAIHNSASYSIAHCFSSCSLSYLYERS